LPTTTCRCWVCSSAAILESPRQLREAAALVTTKAPVLQNQTRNTERSATHTGGQPQRGQLRLHCKRPLACSPRRHAGTTSAFYTTRRAPRVVCPVLHTRTGPLNTPETLGSRALERKTNAMRFHSLVVFAPSVVVGLRRNPAMKRHAVQPPQRSLRLAGLCTAPAMKSSPTPLSNAVRWLFSRSSMVIGSYDCPYMAGAGVTVGDQSCPTAAEINVSPSHFPVLL
jgi:hypothetical protein